MNTWGFITQQTMSLEEAWRRTSLDDRTFTEWLAQLMATNGMTKGEVVRRSGLNPTFGYQILAGQRNAKRDKLIQLAFGMMLDPATMSELLERGGANALSPHNRRDVAIAFCCVHRMDLPACDETLYQAGLATIQPGYPDVPVYY